MAPVVTGRLILVRHPPVTLDWQRRCYGRSDPGLSHTGRAMVAPLVRRLAALCPDVILHSDMVRTRAVALPLARQLGIAALADPLWRERNFGDWEGLSWQRIYRTTGNAMDGMIDDPHGFRPGNGETTAELFTRVGQALTALSGRGLAIVVTHGGPIAAARALHAGASPRDIGHLFVPPGASVALSST